MFLCFRVAFCLILLAAFWLSVSAQSVQQPARQSGTAAVSGVVKLGDAPAVGIPMALISNQNARQPQNEQNNIVQATTDENGVYKFTGLAAGTYRVVPMTETFVINSNTANTPGNPAIPGNAGRPGGFGGGGFGGPGGQGGGKTVTVSDGQMVSQIDFTLARGGVITGRVSDNNDRPVIAERVNLMMVDATGQARPSAGGGNRAGLETDDRGVYRVYGLPAGRYLVSAGNDGGNRIGPVAMRRTSYARTFHPGTTEQSEAQVIEISEGTVAEGIDIRLDGPLKAYAVTGKVLDSQSGQPVPGVTVSVAREARNGRFGPPQPGGGSSGASNEKGEFKITGLMPGKYAASATPYSFSGGTPTTGEFYSGESTSFEISGSDASGIELKVIRGASIAGIVSIEGSNDPTIISKLSQLMVFANSRGAQQNQQRQGPGQGGSTSGRTSLSAVSPEGMFRVSGLAPGTARLSINGGGFGGSGGGAFRLVRIERNGSPINGDIELTSGEDVGGIRIVVGYGSAVIQGRVVVTGGTLPPNARLNVSARSLSNSMPTAGGGSNARVEADGQFRIENLLPGTYEVRLTGNLGGGPGGRGQGGAPGRGGQGGQGAGQQQQPTRLPDVRQTVTVSNSTPINVTLTLNLAQ
ncbi:MAG: carboxypeptidase regulatory-like domain-containing protein [Acidobacteria bacterium]|nr:carboxypeptidase regulatory-like domain-containing protein [Acidobacteriota bacterium]